MFVDDKDKIIEAKNKCSKYAIRHLITLIPSKPDIELEFMDSSEKPFKTFHYIGKEAVAAEMFIESLRK